MAKSERPLTVEIPRPDAEQPAWSRVGVVAIAGFVIGVAWPALLGKKIGPAVPSDLHTQAEASGSAVAAPPKAASGTPAAPTAAPSAEPSDDPEAKPPSANQELVVVGAGRITKCWDKKDKKVDECEKLLFDPLALKRLRELSKCPSALGLDGKMNIGFEVDFSKKEVVVKRVKKGTSLPSSTVGGIVTCAGQQFANVPLDDVPHKHRHYSLEYGLTFYGPGKHPEGVTPADPGGGADPAVGATTSEADASGSAVVAWDTALLRKEPKDGEVVARLVRGTKVKIVGKQSDWYKIESGAKSGWVYRGTIGL